MRRTPPRFDVSKNAWLKFCSVCEAEKPLSDFYTRTNGKPKANCKGCDSEYFRSMPPEQKSKYRARDVNKNKDARALRRRKYYQANKGKIKAYQKRYRQLNKDKFYDYVRKRECTKRGVSVVPFSRSDIIARDGKNCYLCGKQNLADEEIHLDHVIALARGGAHSPDNVRVACKDCNLSKKTKTPEEFLRWKKAVSAAAP